MSVKYEAILALGRMARSVSAAEAELRKIAEDEKNVRGQTLAQEALHRFKADGKLLQENH
jgi:hypothetical protein